MKKLLYTILTCCVWGVFYSCSSDSMEDPNEGKGNAVVVEITTDIQTRTDVIKAFNKGDVMNVFAKTFNKPDAADFISEVKGTYNGSLWITEPQITLKEGERTFIYAYAPYESSISNLTDLSAIPININGQTDILYSGSAIPVSHTTYQAKLTMKHALALFTINIMKQGYTGEGKLQNISLLGNQVYNAGTMNIETGKITGNQIGNLNIETSQTIVDNGWESDLPRLWCIPFSTKLKDAKLKALIDGKEFQAKLPEIEMKSGYQYIFRMVLTDYGLAFIPDQTETISLNQDNDSAEELYNYGVLQIKHHAIAFTVPRFEGDNVFGNITWGDNTTGSYNVGVQHEYSNGSWQCVLETWNSTGFELNNIKGIDAIDISQYLN